MMTTLLRRHPEQNLQRSGFTRIYSFFVMSDHLIYSPNLLLDFANSTLGFRRAFRRKLEIGWGEAFFGDDHDTVSWTPRTISPHPSVHTPLQKQTLLRRGLGFKGVGEPLPLTAGIFVFDAYKMLRFGF